MSRQKRPRQRQLPGRSGLHGSRYRGGTEWAICPVPLAEENSSGKTLSDWFALNGCTGSLDWSKINGSNETKGSLDWQNGGAFTKSGRWYTMTCEKNGVPMVQAEIVDTCRTLPCPSTLPVYGTTG